MFERVRAWLGLQQPKVIKYRSDGWENHYTGASLHGRDKLVSGHFFYEPLDPLTLEQLYYGFDLARKIVHQIVYDAMRQGYELKLPGNEEGSRRQRTRSG